MKNQINVCLPKLIEKFSQDGKKIVFSFVKYEFPLTLARLRDNKASEYVFLMGFDNRELILENDEKAEIVDIRFSHLHRLVIRNCPKLREIYLNKVYIEDVVIENIERLTEISITDSEIEQIGVNNCRRLSKVDFNGNRIRRIGIKETNIPHVEIPHGTELVAVTYSPIYSISIPDTASILNLSHTNVVDIKCDWNSVEYIDIRGCPDDLYRNLPKEVLVRFFTYMWEDVYDEMSEYGKKVLLSVMRYTMSVFMSFLYTDSESEKRDLDGEIFITKRLIKRRNMRNFILPIVFNTEISIDEEDKSLFSEYLPYIDYKLLSDTAPWRYFIKYVTSDEGTDKDEKFKEELVKMLWDGNPNILAALTKSDSSPSTKTMFLLKPESNVNESNPFVSGSILTKSRKKHSIMTNRMKNSVREVSGIPNVCVLKHKGKIFPMDIKHFHIPPDGR